MYKHSLETLGELENIKVSYPNLSFKYNYHKNFYQWSINRINLTDCPLDCSTLLINNTLYINKKNIKQIITFCKKNNYTSILGTLVCTPKTYLCKQKLHIFKQYGFKMVGHCKARNPTQTKHILLKTIKTQRGYI